MKSTILLLTVSLGLSSCAESTSLTTSEPHESRASVETPTVSTISLHVEGMTCKSCENAIKNAIRGLPGVTSVTASHQEERVTVSFEVGKISEDTIKETIIKLGFEIK